MGERTGDENNSKDGDTGFSAAEERDDIPTPPPELAEEHRELIREQPTERLDDLAVYCYRLAAVRRQAEREEKAERPDSIPQALADRLLFESKAILRGIAAHALALTAGGRTEFELGADDPRALPEHERRAKLAEYVERRHRKRRLDKNVPARATVTTKRIESGDEPKEYLYWQYREGDRTTSDYICSKSTTPFAAEK